MFKIQTCSYARKAQSQQIPLALTTPVCLGLGSLLTICTKSREKIWTQQTIAERVQIIAAQMVSPQTLKSRFWRREDKGDG